MDKMILYGRKEPQEIDLTDIFFIVFKSPNIQVAPSGDGLVVTVYGTTLIKPLSDSAVIITKEKNDL